MSPEIFRFIKLNLTTDGLTIILQLKKNWDTNIQSGKEQYKHNNLANNYY